MSIERKRKFKSRFPSVSDVSTEEGRDLYVRFQQVLYVLGAVGGL